MQSRATEKDIQVNTRLPQAPMYTRTPPSLTVRKGWLFKKAANFLIRQELDDRHIDVASLASWLFGKCNS